MIRLSFPRIMAGKRTVFLALDGSKNSECALECKYKLIWVYFDYISRSGVRENFGVIWGRESAKYCTGTSIAKIFANLYITANLDFLV